jgi:hypothetical protein
MNKRLRIYIAGPYTPRNCTLHEAAKIAQSNVDKAIKIGNACMAKGHYVFVPHLSHYQHIDRSSKITDERWWYELDNTFLDHWATALFYMSSSYGTDLELKRAKELKLKIYYKIEDIPKC